MIVTSGQNVTFEFCVQDSTGAAADADSTPTGTVIINGVDDVATVTVTNIDTGRYTAAFTVPTVSIGDVVECLIAATVSGIAAKAIKFRGIAYLITNLDVAVSSRLAPTVSGRTINCSLSGWADTDVKGISGSTTAVSAIVHLLGSSTIATVSSVGTDMIGNYIRFTGASSSNVPRVGWRAYSPVDRQERAVIDVEFSAPSTYSIYVDRAFTSLTNGNTIVFVPDMVPPQTEMNDEVAVGLIPAVSAIVTGGDATEANQTTILAELDLIQADTARISTGGNTFRTPYINGTISIPQGMTWGDTNVAAITINQDGGNWPVLSQYANSGTNGIFLDLSLNPAYTNLTNYSTNVAGLGTSVASFACTSSGSGTNQVISIRPTNTTLLNALMPTNATAGMGMPYRAEVWAINGTNRIALFKGLADVADDLTQNP